MLRFLPRALCFLALATVCIASAGPTPQRDAPANYTLREWHISDGLPSDEIGSLLQDNAGYLWVATSGGLVRFDGTSFLPMPTPPELSPRGMVSQYLPRAHTDQRFIALSNTDANTDSATTGQLDGFFLGDQKTFQFKREPLLAGKSIRTLFTEENGTLWLGCEDGTVLRRQGEQTQRLDPPLDITGRKTPVFATDGDNQVWVSISTFVARYDGTGWRPLPIAHGATEVRIASSRKGGPWLFTTQAALKWTGEKLESVTALSTLQGAHFIQTALEDRYGQLWIGTRSQGLFRISGQSITAMPSSHEDIYSLCEDTEGSIWVGTNGGGLDRLRPKAYQLFDKASGLNDNFSSTLTETADGALWLANRDGGVARITNGKVDPISRRANWRPFSAMSIAPATQGGVWVTSGIGVFRTSPDNPERINRIRSLDNFKIVRATFVTRNGDYWLAIDPDRVARWRDDQVTTFDAASGFDAREVRGFAEDSHGTLWIGAAQGQLFRQNGERFERVPLAGSENCGSLQDLHFEDDGSLLIATSLGGVYIINPTAPQNPRILSTEQGLPNANITHILSDAFGRYWFASRRGIFRITRDQLRDFSTGKIDRVHAIQLGKDDGLPDLSCLGLFQPSALKARDGSLWFATRRGMLRIDPSLVSDDGAPPPVTLSAITFDGLPQPLTTSLNIPANVRKTELHFSALSLSTPDQILVRYRLDGFDNDWVQQPTLRSATYPRLPPGQYLFRVSASNGSGIWSDHDTLLSITVVPRWWQSPWANLFYFLALVIIIVIGVRIVSYRRLRGRLEDLKRESAIERERTRIARNLHDDLGASLTRISLLTQLAQHENPSQAGNYEKIYEATHAVTRSMDEIVWAVNPKCDDLESLVYYIGNFAQSFFNPATTRCRLDMPGVLPPTPLTSQARHNLFLCCKEALNNIAKHARATEVVFTLTLDGPRLQITIADNGQGLTPATPTPAPTDLPPRLSSGNGLKNIRARMEELGGSCTFSTPSTGGTLVTLSLYLPKL